MIIFPNAKINLGIRVLRRRPDDYHQIETVFYPVPLSDILEIIPVKHDLSAFRSVPGATLYHWVNNQGRAEVTFTFSGLDPGGPPEENLVVKVFRLFDAHHSLKQAFSIHLHKIIPSGAGLGGGSADASFVLKALNDLSGKPFTRDELREMALGLGSDCPFFIDNRPVLAGGRGELMTLLELDLSGWFLVIVKPDVHISTAEAFRSVHPEIPLTSLGDLIRLPVEQWQHHLVNDFENEIFKKYPSVGSVKSQLLNNGAVYCGMSGSGSALAALYREKPSLPVFPTGYFVYQSPLT